MDFIYRKIGLDDNTEFIAIIRPVVNRILDGLPSYAENGPIALSVEPNNVEDFKNGLTFLKKNELVLYKHRDDSGLKGFNIVVTNRYSLELLSAELDWLATLEEERDDTAPYVEDLIYYDTNTGEGYFNGLHKTLKKRNKELFNALYIASPRYTDRKKILKIARSGKYADDPIKLVINEALTNLRKVCGVSAHTIELREDGGKLKARTYPLSAQLPLSYFLSD